MASAMGATSGAGQGGGSDSKPHNETDSTGAGQNQSPTSVPLTLPEDNSPIVTTNTPPPVFATPRPVVVTPAPTRAPKICTRLVTRTFTDGVGIKINSQNHPDASEDGQCNTSCHWAKKGHTGCATRDCRAPGTKNDPLCTQCIYTKQVEETYTCN